jgi:hypothetical protein
MPTFNYPTNYELSQIEPDLTARAAAGRLGLDIMPVRNVNAGEVRWSQQDNFYGLQALRGLDGAPTRVQRVGTKTYTYEPGVFGEFIDITETELTRRAGYAPNGTPIDIADLVVDADQQLINREFDRIEATIWALLTTGTFRSRWTARLVRRSVSLTRSPFRRSRPACRGRLRRRQRPSPTSRRCSSSVRRRVTRWTLAPARSRT